MNKNDIVAECDDIWLQSFCSPVHDVYHVTQKTAIHGDMALRSFVIVLSTLQHKHVQIILSLFFLYMITHSMYKATESLHVLGID